MLWVEVLKSTLCLLVFSCLSNCNFVISYFLLTLLNIFTKIKQRCFGRLSTPTIIGASFLPFWRISKSSQYFSYPSRTQHLYFSYIVGSQTHESMCFGVFAITTKQTFRAFYIKLTLCFIKHHHIYYASKYIHVYNARPPPAPRLFQYNGRQGSCWTLITYVNYICHRFRPKRFIETLSIELASPSWCNLHGLSHHFVAAYIV